MAKTINYDFKDLTKQQQECLGLIQSLGIYELRALARVFGDNAPTTLKRNDHINIVMSKIISGEDLQPIPLRQGRPYKELSNIEGILVELSQITGKDYTLKSSQVRVAPAVQKIVTFNQLQESIVSKKMFPIEVRGILQKKNDSELYLINQDNGKYILVKNDNKLKPYDYVTGTAVIMNEEKEYVLDSIKTINYQLPASYHEIYDEYYAELPSKVVKFKDIDLKLGTRYVINGNLAEKTSLKDLISTIKNTATVAIGLFSNVMLEDTLNIKSLGFNNVFMIKYDDPPLFAYQTLLSIIEHINRIQNLGMNVALFINDTSALINAIDYANNNSPKSLMNHTENTVENIKKVVMLAKAGINGKHTTLFVSYDETDLFDPLFVSAIYKVSKKIDIK